MKRWAKAWLAAGVGCCVCGAALTGIGVASGGSKYVKSADLNKMDGAAKKSDNEMVLEKTKLDDFDSADISMTDMNLQVVSSDDQYCYISYRASDQKKDPISYQVKDGKLRIQENNNDGKTYYHVDIGFLSGLLGEGTLTTDENVVTIYVPEGQKWKLADIKSDMSNILLNGCEIENGAVHLVKKLIAIKTLGWIQRRSESGGKQNNVYTLRKVYTLYKIFTIYRFMTRLPDDCLRK